MTDAATFEIPLNAPDYGDWQMEYELIKSSFGLSPTSNRSKVEILGADRAKFIHNLCTNDIKQLEVGQSCEAFLTNAQAKILGHVEVYCLADSLWLDAVEGCAEFLATHLERYHIMENVEILDRTNAWDQVSVVGPESQSLLNSISDGSIPDVVRIGTCEVGGETGVVQRTRRFGVGGWSVRCPRESGALVRLIQKSGVTMNHWVGDRAVDAVRLEHGVPVFGRDISDSNLPQEVGRDELTISFTKGCYIGQETVARIDSYGHVNRGLVGVMFDGDQQVESGLELSSDEKVVGVLCSTAYSPVLGRTIGLAYLRRTAMKPDFEVHTVDGRTAIVAQLPFVGL